MRLLTAATTIIIAVMFAAYPANAQELSTDYTRCMKSAATNPEFSQCTGAEIERQEKLLTAAWSKTSSGMKGASAQAYAALLKEQRAWIVYKDASCEFYDTEDQAFGREGTVLHYGDCKARVIATRVKWLNELGESRKPR